MNDFRANIVRSDTDSYAMLVALVDDACMALGRQARRNARRIARLALALLPLMVLLVGSCKTSGLANAYGGNGSPQQLRAALFPDSVNADAAHYIPAAGYVSRAQDYIKGAPEALKLLTEQEVAYLFGKPSLQRRDADARVWQYKTGACVVDFYFYGAQKQVSYIDVRVQGAMPASALPEKTRAKCIGHAIDGAVFPPSSPV